MSKFYTAPAILPTAPMLRLQPDGSVIRVIPLSRHEIAMPKLVYPEWSWKNEPGIRWPINYGHPEITLFFDRAEGLQDAYREVFETNMMITEREAFLLGALIANAQSIVIPVRDVILREFDPAFLLPADGRWVSYADYVRDFRQAGIEEGRNAIRFIHTATGWLDITEARLERRGAEGGRNNG